jgi:TBCC domain-containing protein 1
MMLFYFWIEIITILLIWWCSESVDFGFEWFDILQLVRSNSKRFTPSQADEEAHQLSYLQKHLANIVSLLAEPVEGESEESLVC